MLVAPLLDEETNHAIDDPDKSGSLRVRGPTTATGSSDGSATGTLGERLRYEAW